MSGTSPPSLAEALRVRLKLNNTELQVLCRLLAWGQICEVMANGHRSTTNRVVDQLRAKLKPHRIKISAVNGGSEFELRNVDSKKLITLGLGNATKSKPTIAAKQI
jgi:predicted transcriptional regulator